MSRIIFLNRYVHPDISATSQIVSDLAFHLAAAGRDVHVITGAQLYDDPARRLPRHERVHGVSIHRVTTTRFGRAGLWGRSLNYLTFYVATATALRRLVATGDIVIAMTDPPLLSLVAMGAVRRGARLVNWLQDLYPEVAIELGVPLVKGPIGRVLAAARDRSLRIAAANVVVGERMADRLKARGMAPGRIHVIPNWSEDEEIVPLAHADNPLRSQWGLEGRFVVGYSGNLGRAHEYDTVLGAAERLKNHPRMLFLIVGGGYRHDHLARQVKERGLEHLFRFEPYQERAMLKYSLGAADIHWISLRPALEGLIVPSKFFGIAAAGRPIAAITADDGEIARLVRRYDCGIVVAPGAADALAKALARLADDPAAVTAMGARARAMLEASFTRRQALARWRNVIDAVNAA